MRNRHGCTLRAQAIVRIHPPDLTVEIIRTQCFTNTSTRVSVRVCVGNGYDSIPVGLPVSFYASDPRSASAGPPISTFAVSSARLKDCDTFAILLPTPGSLSLHAVVNQRNSATFPSTFLTETSLINNYDKEAVVPFTARIQPRPDTFVVRLTGFRLRVDVKGGMVSQYLWQPSQFLNCVDCPSPVGSIPYTSRFSLQARNEYACTFSDTVTVNTYSEGRLFIPNAITPNGDGRNDILYVISNRDVARVLEFSVYDRYGQVVFQARDNPPNDPRYGWNGMRRGVPVASGTFAYFVRVLMVDTRQLMVKGLVTVIK
jgi:gliding motility-associated-like protein